MIRKKYSHIIEDAKKARKRDEANERQGLRIIRGNRGQIARLDSGGYRAKKERARLSA